MLKNDPFYALFNRASSPRVLLAEGDSDPNGGGGGNGAGDGGANTGANSDSLERFARGLESLNNGNTQVGGKLDELIGLVRSAQENSEVGGSDDTPTITTEDLEGMSRADLVAFITGSMTSAFDERLRDALQPIINAITTQQSTVATDQVTRQIETLRSSVKDFDDWKGSMAELAKVHTTLNIRQLYNLARAENPSRAAELDKKHAPPPKPSTPKWGGLTASGGPLTAQALKDAGAVSGREATMEALSEVAERHPVLAGLLNS